MPKDQTRVWTNGKSFFNKLKSLRQCGESPFRLIMTNEGQRTCSLLTINAWQICSLEGWIRHIARHQSTSRKKLHPWWGHVHHDDVFEAVVVLTNRFWQSRVWPFWWLDSSEFCSTNASKQRSPALLTQQAGTDGQIALSQTCLCWVWMKNVTNPSVFVVRLCVTWVESRHVSAIHPACTESC